MNLRFTVGLAVVIIGLAMIAYYINNLNELLFIQGKTSATDVPLYRNSVAAPILFGILLVLDGIVICGLARRASLFFHSLASMIWLYSSYKLYLALQDPLTSRLLFYGVFLFFMLSIILFVLGTIVNFIPKGS